MRMICSFIYLFASFQLFSQEIGVGEWNMHLPYRNAIAVAEADNRIYCASENALFYYDLNDNSINTLSKANGLSDAGINTIAYSKEYEILIIAYSNGNIDLIENDKVINLSDIKRKPITGTKSINHIFLMDNEAWMACSFGIVVLDITSKNFLGNWVIGANGSNVEIKDLTFDGQYIYASTVNGVYQADINSTNIQDYNYWSQMSGLPDGTYNSICYFAGKVFTNYSTSSNDADTLYEYDGTLWKYASIEGIDSSNTYRRTGIRQTNNYLVISHYYGIAAYNDSLKSVLTSADYGSNKDVRDGLYDRSGYLWLADNGYGLVKSGPYGGTEIISPSGPVSINVFDIASSNNEVWIAPGGLTPNYSNTFTKDGISFNKDGMWSYYTSASISELDSIPDIITIAIHPNNPSNIFLGSSKRGVLELNGNDFANLYSYYNSTLSYADGEDCASWCRIDISDMEFDESLNLWVLNPTVDKPLSVKLSTNEWKNFSCDNLVSTSKRPLNLLIDPYNQKWISLVEGGGVLVFNEMGTYDDETDDLAKVLNTTAGNGGLHTNSVTCVALDLNNAVWIGTNEGPCIISSPENVFTENDFDSYRPTIEYDGHPEYLLQNETVTEIAVDGANRKWVGTETSGVYLISEDGTEQIEHFDEDNSPLPSNNIRTIEINQYNGEVFFGTDKGLVSYKGTATEGSTTNDNLYIYPNPVRESFNGSIAIRGLVAGSDVKITNITGDLVYQTIADGGQAIWNGKNFKGEAVRTGIYLVFCTSPDGSENGTGKIAIIR